MIFDGLNAGWIAAGAALAVIAITPGVRVLALALGAVAYPKEDRWHTRSIPMLGGVAIFLAVALSVGALADVNAAAWPAICAGAGMFALGVLDDFVKLKPSTKLTGQIAVASMVVAFWPMPSWTDWPASNVILALFWILVVTNAFNLLDNMDGLCAGVAAIAGLTCWTGLVDGALANYAAALTGASAGFLIFNFKPATIFMGDGGSLFLGGSLAVLSLVGDASRPETSVLSAIAVPVFLLLIPIFDTTFVTLSRLLSTRSAAQGGRDHTSHRLVAMGFSERRAVLTLYLLAAAGGAAAVIGRNSEVYGALLMGPLLLIALALLGIRLARVKVYDGEDFSLLVGKPYTPLLINITFKRRMFEVLLDLLLITFSYYSAYVLRFDDELAAYYPLFVQSLPIVITCHLVSFFIVGVYRGIWQFISLGDLSTYAKGIALGTLGSVAVLVYLYRFAGYSRGVFAIQTMMLALLVVGTRLSFRVIGETAGRHRRTGRRAIIYGAGDGGALLLRELRNNAQYDYDAVAFVDDDPSKARRKVLGLPVLGGIEEVETIIAERQPEVVIVSTGKIDRVRQARLQRICYTSGTALLQMRLRLDDVASETSSLQD
jgi:UDP-GlcNAc:undecaprenyl-phosphate/decaprenyl-phosphate GlcNAc-1-phosphate transferase